MRCSAVQYNIIKVQKTNRVWRVGENRNAQDDEPELLQGDMRCINQCKEF